MLSATTDLGQLWTISPGSPWGAGCLGVPTHAAGGGVARDPLHPLLISECLCFPSPSRPRAEAGLRGHPAWDHGSPAVG